MHIPHNFVLTALLLCVFASSIPASAQSKPQSARPSPTPTRAEDFPALRKEGLDLAGKNQYVAALPFLEKIASVYTEDAEVQTHYGIAILVTALTSNDPAVREQGRQKALAVLRRAKALGTENQIALHYLDGLENPNNMLELVGNAANKEVEDAIREGEAHFGRGEYDKAFVAYERAHRLDPKSYEAALFAGDCFYAQRRYAESEPWFAKAVAINPNREQAYRFWGDALVNQGKLKEGLAKFADAVIAEPNSRLAWNQLLSWVQENGARKSSPFISAPGSEDNDSTEIKIDASLLKADDGTAHWRLFDEKRKARIAVSGKEPTIADDAAALKSVAEAVRADAKAGKVKTMNASLANLLVLDEKNMLDVYALMFLHGGDGCPEYEDFREKNRDKMRRFFVEYFAGMNSSTAAL